MDRPVQSNQSLDRAVARGRTERGFKRIRIGAKALISDRDRVLLIRERREDGSTFWTLPGGGVRLGESVAEGLHRELKEELRSRATIGAGVATCTYEHTTCQRSVTVYRIFACELEDSPTPNRAEGIIEQTWAPPTNLPSATLDPFRRLLQTCLTRQDIDN